MSSTGRSMRARSSRTRLARVLLAVLLFMALPLAAACKDKRVLGSVNMDAPVALVRYEEIEDGLAGVVYREVRDLPSYLAGTARPVMMIFYQPGDAYEPQLIPVVEQFADDFKDKVDVIFINVTARPSLSVLYGIETVPQYILVQSGAARLTMNGFDSTTRAGLEQMLQNAG